MNNSHSLTSSTAIQAVVFDLDGVLINTEWLGFDVWREWAERHGARLSEDIFPEITVTSQEETGALIMKRTGISFDLAESTAWAWQQVTKRLKSQAAPLPGARELVKSLANRGYPLAIASNSITSYIDSALTGLGLIDRFPIRVSIDQVPEGKPAPDVYLSAAQRLGVEPQHCLAVEDSRVGMQAATAAGMRVVVVPDPRNHLESFQDAWRVYPSLVQVEQDLDEILQ